MSATLCFPTHAEDYFNPGVSREARDLNKLFGIVDSEIRKNAKFEELAIALEQAYSEANHAGWDGHDALPASPQSFELATNFIRCLPIDAEMPEVSVDPDGDISFEWFKSKSRLVILSFGKDRAITYVGFLGKTRNKGVETFDFSIPANIKNLFQSILS